MALCSKNVQTETNYVVSVCIFFSRFEGTRGDKNMYSAPLAYQKLIRLKNIFNFGSQIGSSKPLYNNPELF